MICVDRLSFANSSEGTFRERLVKMLDIADLTCTSLTLSFHPQVKKRMTKTDFIKNNRGINANEDLPEEFLSQIFDDIQNNEIRMKDEVEAGLPVLASGPGLASAIANVGRDLQREAYVLQSNGMANKTEVSRSRQAMVYFNHRTGTF